MILVGSIPNSSGRYLGQTFSLDVITEAARVEPISMASSIVLPYVKPIATPAQKASPAPVVSFTWIFTAGHMPFYCFRLAYMAPLSPIVTTMLGIFAALIFLLNTFSNCSGVHLS